MAFEIKVVDRIPHRAGRRGPRSTVTRDIFEEVSSCATGRVAVQFTDKHESERIYKSLIQYRIRHFHKGEMELQKDGLTIYVWRHDAPTPSVFARRPRPALIRAR